MDFTKDLQLRNEELPEDYWREKRTENAERISRIILSSSNEELKECWDWITEKGHNNFLVALIYWSMDEEYLQRQTPPSKSTFNMGWTALFLREEKVVEWLGAIEAETEEFTIELEEDNWVELMNIYTEKRAEAGFTMRSGLKVAYAVLVGFLLLKLPGQKAGLSIKDIKETLRNDVKKARLLAILTDKNSKALKFFKSRPYWTATQFPKYLNLGETESAPPGRPSRASSASSGKQGYTSSVTSGETPVNQATIPNPASSQTNQQPPPQDEPIIDLRSSDTFPVRPTGSQPENSGFSTAFQSNLQRPLAPSTFTAQVPPQASGNSNLFDLAQTMNGMHLAGIRLQAANQQQNVVQQPMQHYPHVQASLAHQLYQQMQHPTQVQRQRNVGQAPFQPSVSQNQPRQLLPVLPPDVVNNHAFIRQERNSLPGYMFQTQGGAWFRRSDGREELVSYERIMSVYRANVARQRNLENIPNNMRPQNPMSLPQNSIPNAQTTQAPQPTSRVPPKKAQTSAQVRFVSDARDRTPPAKSPQSPIRPVHTSGGSQQRHIRPNGPTQQPRPLNQQRVGQHIQPQQQSLATSPPVAPQRREIPQQQQGQRIDRPVQQPRQAQGAVAPPRPRIPQQSRGVPIVRLPNATLSQQVIPNNNNGITAAHRVLALPDLPNRMRVTGIRLPDNLPENGSHWGDDAAIWIMQQAEYQRLSPGYFICVQITRPIPAELHQKWLVVRARLMEVRNFGRNGFF